MEIYKYFAYGSSRNPLDSAFDALLTGLLECDCEENPYFGENSIMYSTLSVALAEMQPWRGAGFFPFQLLWAQFGNWEEEGG